MSLFGDVCRYIYQEGMSDIHPTGKYYLALKLTQSLEENIALLQDIF